MSEGASRARVGVRELRQNLSVYLRRVEQGETLDVTDRGRTVARLGPLPASDSGVLERLIADHRARPATGRIESLPEPIAVDAAESVSEALRRMRVDER
jgi:prevent-host-death family protein